MNLLDYEPRIHDLVVAKGEKDGDSHRFYLTLNDVVSIDHGSGVMTDVLFAHVGADDALTFFVSDSVDDNQDFVGIGELPFLVVNEAYRQMSETAR